MLAYCVEHRNYDSINEAINRIQNTFSYVASYENSILGYKIQKINQLSNIYKFDVFAVSFYFTNITHEFNEYFDEKIGVLVQHFVESLKKINGYIIIKVPSSNSMLINQLNKANITFLYAGGTVCYYSNKQNEKVFNDDSLVIKMASTEDKLKYRSDLIELGRKSFEKYFGQYHISYITREKAPLIYENWVEEYLNDEEDNLFVAFIDNRVVGFMTFNETVYANEIVLGGIDSEFRNKKIYERMIRYITKYSLEKEKITTISTQLDNFFVQRAWVNIGYKPYYSFYLFHLNANII